MSQTRYGLGWNVLNWYQKSSNFCHKQGQGLRSLVAPNTQGYIEYPHPLGVTSKSDEHEINFPSSFNQETSLNYKKMYT